MLMFFEELARFDKQVAVIDGCICLSYHQLHELVEKKKRMLDEALGSKKQVVALVASNSVASLVNYLALLQLRQTIFFADSTDLLLERTSDTLSLKERFGICVLLKEEKIECLSDPSNHKCDQNQVIYPDIALLMGTSGSTGAAKYVMLSYENLHENTQDICAYLPIESNDKTITTLPFSYAYGLSIINTHLNQGAAIVFTQYSVMQREFWALLDEQQITSFGGVPYTYEMLLRLIFTQTNLPHLRYFTQAGGKLSQDKLKLLVEFAQSENKQFFVMYGQTEATARMSYADTQKLAEKPASIGGAIPNTRFELVDEHKEVISVPRREGELVFYGKNVMLGYARHYDDLCNIQALTKLETGDLAYFDEQGDFYICGRIKRIVKLFGERFNLDDLQEKAMAFFETKYPICVGDDKHLFLLFEGDEPSGDNRGYYEQGRKDFAKYLKLHHSSVKLHFVKSFFRTQNGKLDYARLQAEILE